MCQASYLTLRLEKGPGCQAPIVMETYIFMGEAGHKPGNKYSDGKMSENGVSSMMKIKSVVR